MANSNGNASGDNRATTAAQSGPPKNPPHATRAPILATPRTNAVVVGMRSSGGAAEAPRGGFGRVEGRGSPPPPQPTDQPEAGEPPASNTGATFQKISKKRASDEVPDGYGWDWSATTHKADEGIVADLANALGTRYAVPGKGLQGWSQSVECYDAEGYRLGQVFYGAARDDVHVLSTSYGAHAARAAVVGLGEARTARVDTCVDTLVSFEALTSILDDAAGRYGSRLTRIESWQGSMSGDSLGRTLYLGAPSSRLRVRLYEKWLESPGEYVEGTNRVEVQLRPDSKAKERVSSWSAAETFCASRVTKDLAAALGTEVADPESLRVKRGTPTLDETMRWMGSQYGNAFEKFMEFTQGDVTKVLGYLAERGA